MATITDAELRLIVGALRHAALDYEVRAKAAAAKYQARDAAQFATFAAACANLSDKLEGEHPSIVPKIIRPRSTEH